MKKLYPILVGSSALLLGLVFAPSAGASVINVNVGDAGGANALNGYAYMTGGYAQAPVSYSGTTWNDYSTAPNYAIGPGLLDSKGNITGVGFSTTGGTPMQGPANWADHPDVPLLQGGLYRAWNDGSGNTMTMRISVTGLNPASLYHVVVVGCRQDTAQAAWGIGTSTVAPAFTKTINNDVTLHEGWGAGTNYAIFYRVAPQADGTIFVWGKGTAPSSSYNGLTLNGFQIVDAADLPSADKDILNCSFGALGYPAGGVTNFAWPSGTNATLLTCYVPTGTNVTALAPTFTISDAATLSPLSGSTQNFTTPVQYTVTAQDGSTKVYTVAVAFASSYVIPISTTYTPGPQGTSQGIAIDTTVTNGNIGLLVGSCQTYWGSHGFTVPIMLNGYPLIVDSGGGNEPYHSFGPISGYGSVTFNTVTTHKISVAGTNTYSGTTTVQRGYISLENPDGVDALLGNITVGTTSQGFLYWTAGNQINDAANITVLANSYLNLNGFSDTINSLTLPATPPATKPVVTGLGTTNDLKVTTLTMGGTNYTTGYFGAGEAPGYVSGSGYILVGGTSRPTVTQPPAAPSTPSPTNNASGIYPFAAAPYNTPGQWDNPTLTWAESLRATSYDLYLWLATDTEPASPTVSGLTSATYTPPLLNDNAQYLWQVVANNTAGSTPGPQWTFTTRSRSDVYGTIVSPNTTIGSTNSANLIGNADFDWQTYNCAISVTNNGYLFTMNSGGGNPYDYTGIISGSGGLYVVAGGANPIRIGGSSGNTYTGPTTVTHGTVNLEKSYGNALQGTITVGTSGLATLVWTANDQISDASDLTLVTSGSTLQMGGFNDTIKSLTMPLGTLVDTTGGSVLTVSSLTLGGASQPPGTYDRSGVVSQNYIVGEGSIVVGAAAPPFPASGFSLPGGVPTFQVPTELGKNYTLFYKDNLTDATWTALTGSGTGAGTGSPITLSDPTTPLPGQRFYRLGAQ